MLTQNYLKELFEYSEDGNLIWRVNRSKVRKGSIAGTWHRQGYTLVGIDGKMYLRHRLIFLYHHGFLPPRIDHRDRDSTNDRIENLRPISQRQNTYNQHKQKNTSSKYRGVSLIKATGKWLSQIRLNGKPVYLGSYKTQEAAAVAFNMAVINHNLLPFVPLNVLPF